MKASSGNPTRLERSSAPVAFVTGKVDSLTFTLLHAMTFQGMEVNFLYDRAESGRRLSEISRMPGVRLSCVGNGRVDEAGAGRRVVVQGHPHLPSPKALEIAGHRVREPVTFITAGDRGQPRWSALKVQVKEFMALRRAGIPVGRVVYKDGYRGMDLYRALHRPRFICGFDVHSQFLTNPRLFELIFSPSWLPDEPRSFRISFLGSLDPRGAEGFCMSFDATSTGPRCFGTNTRTPPGRVCRRPTTCASCPNRILCCVLQAIPW
ncbi:hypothetical protein SAMN02746041_02613 [Desulfacinum hydrothermale DSM 13146]|uniref:Uncharacterized protein n=1 Tax=Desulfacinum hydrothermale DSM 13146 TaxID=1121390 RepID=A0A1W1XR54_9BACT|nr:hypothetical protein SAMN02746041_02613 [Desulfacinum hydrothermale DSM 13146]